MVMKLLEAGADLTTMTRYREDFDCPVAFPEQDGRETMAEVLAEQGARQLHVAETEKYAHVTYFFNGGREEEWPGETRVVVPSPRDVPSYDHKPEMSAAEVARRFAEEIGEGYRFGVVNFANPDMVGHTGVIPAVVRAVEAADAALGVVVEAVERAGGACLITADHGNAEQMLGSRRRQPPHGAHHEPRSARADRHQLYAARGGRTLRPDAHCPRPVGSTTTFTDVWPVSNSQP